MTIPQALAAYAAASVALTVTPGLDTALVLRVATVEGRTAGSLAAAGICTGCLVWGVAASVGLGAVLTASAFAYGVLRLAGAAYLVFLGTTFLLHRPSTTSTTIARAGGSWFRRGLSTNLLNPKVGVFYVTFLPQFIPDGVRAVPFSLLLAAIHAVEGALWFAALVTATGCFSHWLGQPSLSRAINRVTGAVLIGSGAALALTRRR